jgi:hypothetical protein
MGIDPEGGCANSCDLARDTVDPGVRAGIKANQAVLRSDRGARDGMA